MDEVDLGSLRYREIAKMNDWRFEQWCRENGMDPQSLEAIRAYEDIFDPTDDMRY